MTDDKHYRYKRYDLEFKRNAVDLLEATGRPMAEVAGDLGIPYKTLERWRQQLRKRGGALPPLDDAQAQELARLRKRLADTEMERDILKKALAICSRETRGGGASS